MGGKKEFNTMMDSVFVIPGKLGMESRGMIHETPLQSTASKLRLNTPLSSLPTISLRSGW